MAKAFTWGFLCLSDIPRSRITIGTDGKKYIDVKVMLKNTPEVKEKHVVEAFIAAATKKDEQLPAGEKAIFGNLGNWRDQMPSQVSAVPDAQPVTAQPVPAREEKDDLPF